MNEPFHACHEGVRFTDADVVNPDEYDPDPRRRAGACVPWLLHDHGFALCVVFASCEQDALDEAVDHDKLDRYLVTDWADYPKEEGLMFLGNASEPFDIESLAIVRLPNPPFSFVALFNSSVGGEA